MQAHLVDARHVAARKRMQQLQGGGRLQVPGSPCIQRHWPQVLVPRSCWAPAVLTVGVRAGKGGGVQEVCMQVMTPIVVARSCLSCRERCSKHTNACPRKRLCKRLPCVL